ncbi:MAG: hypothetical protein NDJ94_00425 [Vicinamibacteria bacterium]|nr:hypothetical protein [Vicinamibacteria bacterium]
MPRRLLWVVVLLLLPFRAQHVVLAPAAWIAPVLLLHLVRTGSGRRTWAALAAAMALAELVTISGGYLPLPLSARLAVAMAAGATWSLPYLADHVARRRSAPARAALAFPAAMASLDLLLARVGPTGAWGSPAHAHVDNLPLLQLVAVTGTPGLSFLTAWSASALCDAWQAGSLRPLRAWLITLCAVSSAGAIRLALADPEPRLAVAAIAPSAAELRVAFEGLSTASLARADEGLRRRWGAAFRPLAQRMVDRSLAAAAAGARLVAWPEGIPVLEEDWADLDAGLSQLARSQAIHLAIAPWRVLRTRQFPWVENRSVLYGPDGSTRWQYSKVHLVPGLETSKMVAGRAAMPVVDSGHGRWTGAICFDFDFPAFVRAAGPVDLLVAPADDWPAIAAIHPRMAVFRAVETGAALLRPASNGRSLITDGLGRIQGEADSRSGDVPVLLTSVPLRGRTTPYSRVGDTFGGLCLLLLGLLLVGDSRSRRAA